MVSDKERQLQESFNIVLCIDSLREYCQQVHNIINTNLNSENIYERENFKLYSQGSIVIK